MDYRILTNNPLVRDCMAKQFLVDYEDISFRDILVRARDLVYEGYELYTHPLAGSVKPNETPYKSVVVSQTPHGFSAEQAEIIANSIQVFDKFVPRKRTLTQKVLEDFQLIDYTLLASALHFDAAAGLSNKEILK